MARAVERLQPLRVGEPRVEAAGDVHGDVIAAERNGVEMGHVAAREHGDATSSRAPMSTTMTPISASSGSSTERPAA